MNMYWIKTSKWKVEWKVKTRTNLMSCKLSSVEWISSNKNIWWNSLWSGQRLRLAIRAKIQQLKILLDYIKSGFANNCFLLPFGEMDIYLFKIWMLWVLLCFWMLFCFEMFLVCSKWYCFAFKYLFQFGGFSWSQCS